MTVALTCQAVLGALLVAITVQARADTLSEKLKQLDRQAKTIQDLTTEFVEEKFTTLLKKPLVSRGRVFVKGKRTRWQTTSPRESTLFTDESHVAVYFPSRATMEVYPVDRRLRALMVSPVPRVATLKKHFDIALAPKQSDSRLNLRLTPKDDSLREYMEEIIVSVDLGLGLATRIEMFDPEGDRTVITFDNVRTNVGLSDSDVARRVPAGTKIVRPLDAKPQPDTPPQASQP